MVLFAGFLSGTGTLQKNVDPCFKTLFNSTMNNSISLKKFNDKWQIAKSNCLSGNGRTSAVDIYNSTISNPDSLNLEYALLNISFELPGKDGFFHYAVI